MERSYKPWTKAEVEMMVTMINLGAEFGEVALSIERTITAVISRYRMYRFYRFMRDADLDQNMRGFFKHQ